MRARILDARFKYVPALATNVVATWRRFGYRPTTDAERLARQRGSEKSMGNGHGPSVFAR